MGLHMDRPRNVGNELIMAVVRQSAPSSIRAVILEFTSIVSGGVLSSPEQPKGFDPLGAMLDSFA